MTRRLPAGQARRPANALAPKLRRDDFPSLAGFLRGYLHEDFAEVHGSARDATAAFCRDATQDERRELAQELSALVKVAASLSPRDLRRFVTRDLGSRWEPASAEQLTELLEMIRATI